MKTVRELFDLMAGDPAAIMQNFTRARQGQNWNDANYDPYHPEADLARGAQGTSRSSGSSSSSDDPVEDIAGAVFGAAMGFVGKAIAKKMQKAFQERVVPAMQQKAAQTRQQWLPSEAEQDTIAERYPELRGCLRDQVAFLAGGTRTIPIKEIQMPITLASVDSLVARLQ